MRFDLSAGRFRRMLVVVVCCLTVLSLAGNFCEFYLGTRLGGLVRVLDVDSELSLPNWYSILGLALSSTLLGTVAATLRSRGAREDLFAWSSLSAIFALLSVDELVGIHEGIGHQVKALFKVSDGWFAFAWVIPALILLPLVGACYINFLRRLPARRRVQFIVSGLIFVGGAVGFELLGGKLYSVAGSPVSLPYQLCTHTEEFMEMLAIVLFNSALIEHLAGLLGDAGVTLKLRA